MRRFDVRRKDRLIIGTGSSGCQLKWVQGCYYIKLAVLGYEHVAEVLTSEFLSLCDLRGFSNVKYNMCEIYEDGIYRGQGCYCKSFVDAAEVEVSVSDMILRTGSSYALSHEDALDLIYDYTGLWCKDYLNTMLAIDAIVKNGDRHFRNISFIKHSDGNYAYAPMFDFGDAMLSDVISYPMDAQIDECLRNVYAKPFSVIFGKDISDFVPIPVDADESKCFTIPLFW